jgi:hypothetical protein
VCEDTSTATKAGSAAESCTAVKTSIHSKYLSQLGRAVKDIGLSPAGHGNGSDSLFIDRWHPNVRWGPPNLEECGNQSDVPQCGSDRATIKHANEKATGKTGSRMMVKWLPDGNIWPSTNPAVEFRLTLKGLWYGEGHLQGMLPPLVSCGAHT